MTLAFMAPLMSVLIVENADDLRKAKSDIPNVLLLTGRGCRSCAVFKKRFIRLHEQYDRVRFYEMVLNDVDDDPDMRRAKREYSNERGVKTIPMLIFQEQKNEEEVTSLISGVKQNFDFIDERLREMNTVGS